MLNRNLIGRIMEYHRRKPNDSIKYGTLSPDVLARFGYSCRGAPWSRCIDRLLRANAANYVQAARRIPDAEFRN